MIRLMIATAALFIGLTDGHTQVQFVDAPFTEVLSMAKTQEKFVLVDAYTDWCGWCKVMDRETFSDSATAAFLDARFVSTKINMEEGFGIDLAMKYRVSSYPQYLFFNENGALLARLSGFMNPAPFMAAIEQVFESRDFLPPSPDPLNFTEGFPDFLRNSYKKNKERSNPGPEEVQAFLDAQEDFTTEPTWAVVSRFVGGGPYAAKAIGHRDALIEKYGRDDVMKKFSSFVFNDVKVAIKEKDEDMLDAILANADAILGEEAPAYKLRYRLYFYQMTEAWEAYAKTAAIIANDPAMGDPATVNQMAWTIYEKAESQDAVQQAITWMEKVVANESTYAYLDTYAALLFKGGRHKEALTYAERALEAGTNEEANTEGTQQLIDQIKAL